MKERVRRQVISCLVAAILFLSGMCVEFPRADVFFLYAKDAYEDEFNRSAIREESRLAKLERVCTIDSFQRNTSIFLNSNRNQNAGKRILRGVATFAIVGILLSCKLLSFGMADILSSKLRSSHVIIVRYMQQTDGKK